MECPFELPVEAYQEMVSHSKGSVFCNFDVHGSSITTVKAHERQAKFIAEAINNYGKVMAQRDELARAAKAFLALAEGRIQFFSPGQCQEGCRVKARLDSALAELEK